MARIHTTKTMFDSFYPSLFQYVNNKVYLFMDSLCKENTFDIGCIFHLVFFFLQREYIWNEIYSTESLLSSNSLRGIITDTSDIGKKITELSDKFPIYTKSHRYEMMNKWEGKRKFSNARGIDNHQVTYFLI
jgi:hypothetical protein